MDIFAIFALVYGLCIGSFLNVVIFRLPNGQSVAFPRSHCPNCSHPLSPVELIPVISYFLLRGRCGNCNLPISKRYLIIESLTGIIFLLLYLQYGLTNQLGWALFLAAFLIAVIMIDIDHQIIPDTLNFVGLISGIVFSFFHQPWYASWLGLLTGSVLLLLIAVVSKGGMGGGDVKLAGVLGLFLGWKMILLALLLSFWIGGVGALILLLSRKKGRKDYIPFGPYIATGGMISFIWGDQILIWYLNFLGQ